MGAHRFSTVGKRPRIVTEAVKILVVEVLLKEILVHMYCFVVNAFTSSLSVR